MENLNNKTEQIVDSVYDAGWNGAIEAVKMGDRAFAQGVKTGKRRGFVKGLFFAAIGAGIAAAIKTDVVSKVKNLFKKPEDNLDDDFELDDYDDAN